MESQAMQLTPMVTDLAKRYAAAKARVDEANKVLDELKTEKDQLQNALKDEMERLDLQKFQLTGLGTFFIQSMRFAKAAGDPMKAIEWLDEQGLDIGQGIAPRTINGKKLKEYLDDRLDNDQMPPPTEIIESASITFVKMLKAKG